MNKKRWISTAAVVIVGLYSGSLVCQADSLSQPPHDPDLRDSYSASALYNLANSYARQGKPALAVLNYERARLLAPLDPDIRANLRRVRESVGLTSEAPSLADQLRWLSPNTTYWIGFMGLLLAGAGWLLLSFRKLHRIAARAALATGLLMMAFTFSDALAIEREMHCAVVLRSAAASASPIFGAETIFMVPQAAIVQQQDQHGSFSLIRDSQGRVGWVSQRELTPIVSP